MQSNSKFSYANNYVKIFVKITTVAVSFDDNN